MLICASLAWFFCAVLVPMRLFVVHAHFCCKTACLLRGMVRVNETYRVRWAVADRNNLDLNSL